MRFSIDFSKAFFFILRHSAPIWVGIVILITLIGLLIAELETDLSLGSAIYFAWVTGTTVGYGDLVPTSGITRFLAIVIAVLGIVFTGIVVAIAVEAAKIALDNNSSLQAFKQAAADSTKQRVANENKRSLTERKEES